MSDDGHTEPGRGAEWWGKSPFGYFLGLFSFPKVTRCKSGTNSRRDRSNGYVHRPKTIAVELHLEALYIQDYWHLVLR